MTGSEKLFHFYRRAGFGVPMQPFPKDNLKLEDVVHQCIHGSSIKPLQAASGFPMMSRDAFRDLSKAEKQQIKDQMKELVFALNAEWLEKMTTDKDGVAEKMTLFWHNHFACREDIPPYTQSLINTIRQHALGDFRTMLKQVSREPAMLRFLNNLQNKKQHPNENFAREVMELFTMGVGNYTEKDIKESARAFTGWSLSEETGEFLFRERIHDTGIKDFLGRQGNFNGDDILDIILEQEATARFIAGKIYRCYVNPVPNKEHVEAIAAVFRKNYHIGEMMEFVFTSPWFYSDENRLAVVKSPVDLLVEFKRMFSLQFEEQEAQLRIQRALNQVLFFPPNVAGWPGGLRWIDNSTLMLRLRMASVLTNDGDMHWEEKGDMPEDFRRKNEVPRKLKATASWTLIDNTFEGWSGDAVAACLVGRKDTPAIKDWLERHPQYSRTALIELMSLPEFQLT
jgi:uncharacterized protein (DUF1800 family)